MERTINKYRYFCVTESNFKTQWSETPPSVCASSSNHNIDENSVIVIDSIKENAQIIKNLPKTTMDEVRVAERTILLDLKSIFGKSTLRDLYIETGTGTVTNNIGDSEYTLQVNSTNDVAWIQSAERGRYIAGMQGEMGAGVRLVNPLVENQTLKIGLFDSSNGFYFKYTSSNLFATILKNGTEVSSVPRNQWNIDSFDGNGPSKYTLNSSDGIIYNIRFTWYGYGNIEYRLNTNNPFNEQNSYLGHVYNPLNETSVQTPNLPISICLENNGTNSAGSAKVAGRQYSLLGKYTPIYRINGATRLSVGTNINTFVPLMSIRRKTGYLGVGVKNLEADIIPTGPIIIQIRTGGTLTNASFVNIPDTAAANTAIEHDISASAITGGIPIWTGFVTGEAKNTLSGAFNAAYDLTNQEILTVCARSILGNLTASIALRWTEEW